MKVFISHKAVDAALATRVRDRLLLVHQIQCYLDVVDPALDKKGEDLAAYLRERMGSCTQLLAIVSAATQTSQWVPWEIGVATEKDFPLATYSDGTRPPEFLAKWPYMTNTAQLDVYAEVSKASNSIYESRRFANTASTARGEAVKSFYSSIRSRLGQ
jgi:hypothetical protein